MAASLKSSRDEETKESRWLKDINVNVNLLPIKLHYFLYYGAVGCVVPYLPLVAKNLGINATAVGIIFSVLPFVVFFSKPAFGAITDHFRNIKVIMFILVIFTILSFALIILIPPIATADVPSPPGNFFSLNCSGRLSVIKIRPKVNLTCAMSSKKTFCDLAIKRCISHDDISSTYSCGRECNQESSLTDYKDLLHTNSEERNAIKPYHQSEGLVRKLVLAENVPLWNILLLAEYLPNIISKNISFINRNLTTDVMNESQNDVVEKNQENYLLYNREKFAFRNKSIYELLCGCKESTIEVINCKPNLHSCFIQTTSTENTNVYQTYQYWVFALLAIISGACFSTVSCLSDAACNERICEKKELYGKQRLWGTISWGLATLLTGFLNDTASAASSHISYNPGFYALIVLACFDLVVLYQITLTKANFSTSICTDVGKMFQSCEIICFSIAVFIIGGLSGLLWNYQFWYLQDLGATQVLLGLTVAIQCLVAEVPFFFLSGKIIRTVGHLNLIIVTFAVFGLRYVLYFFLKNPWYTLPIEVLHGQTYAVFYATMMSYAVAKAPTGTEATMIGVLGGLFEGLGVAVGSLLSGVGFDNLSGRYTFLIAGILSFLCTILYLFIKLAIRSNSNESSKL